jgi:hypothetical protein
MVIICW